MLSDLYDRLLERKAIDIDTELQVRKKNKSMSVVVKNITTDYLECYSTIDGHPVIVNSAEIETIDGMQISRIMRLYDINDDGTLKEPKYKKRGRKRKEDQ